VINHKDGYTFDDNYLTYSDNLNTVLGVLRTQFKRKYNKSFDTASNEKFDFVDKSIKNKEIKSAIICFLAGKSIPEQTEDEKKELLKYLNPFSIKTTYLEHIKNTEASTAIGKKAGNKAKYIETLISYNKDFSIKQLEGKTVYIDNWATWCGPCMKSMKAFKEKQKILNRIEDVVFVFVSFDRNENIWRNYVKKSLAPNQNIIHLYNGMKMDSKYGKYYNISGLPSYLVIDKQGLIYDINPKNPSDNNFEQYLKQL
jgi:thiol-disulfide isomerase/thioredoxin